MKVQKNDLLTIDDICTLFPPYNQINIEFMLSATREGFESYKGD